MNKLISNAIQTYDKTPPQADVKSLYISGFKDAFAMIETKLNEEMKLLEKYPFHGERIMTLKIYKNKIEDILKDMEKEYV